MRHRLTVITLDTPSASAMPGRCPFQQGALTGSIEALCYPLRWRITVAGIPAGCAEIEADGDGCYRIVAGTLPVMISLDDVAQIIENTILTLET